MKFRLLGITVLSLILIFSLSMMANAGKVVNIENIDSYNQNPALSGTDNEFTFQFMGYGQLMNNAIDSSHLHSEIKESDKDSVISSIGDDGLVILGDGFQGAEFNFKVFSAATGLRQMGALTLDSDVIELFLEGNEVDREYDFSGTGGEFVALTDMSLGFSQDVNTDGIADVESMKVGVKYHYLSGLFGLLEGDGSLTFESGSDPISGNGKARLEYAEESVGHAFDIGMEARLSDNVSCTAAILNLGSLIGYDARYSEYEYDADSNTYEETTDQPLSRMVYELPREYKVDIKYGWYEDTDVYSGYSQQRYGSGHIDHRFGIGMEFKKYDYFPFRAGIDYSSLRGDFSLSTGVGIKTDVFEADIGFADVKGLFGSSKNLSLGVSAGLLF